MRSSDYTSNEASASLCLMILVRFQIHALVTAGQSRCSDCRATTSRSSTGPFESWVFNSELLKTRDSYQNRIVELNNSRSWHDHELPLLTKADASTLGISAFLDTTLNNLRTNIDINDGTCWFSRYLNSERFCIPGCNWPPLRRRLSRPLRKYSHQRQDLLPKPA